MILNSTQAIGRATISVRDVQTQQVFTVPASENMVVREIKGVKVKLYPVVLQTMVRNGAKFDAPTITGALRPMIKIG